MWKRVSLVLFTLVMTVMLSGAPAALAQSNADGSWGGRCTGESLGHGDVATIQGLECAVANALTVILSLLTLVGFVMFIYGALMFMLSGGQPQKMEKAKDTITYVIIGIVLALSSFIIINIIAQFTGLENSILIINWDAVGLGREAIEGQ